MNKRSGVKTGKWAVVDVGRCKPAVCGTCSAARACPHHIMDQEGPGEVPMLWSETACVGCGLCAQTCPFHAVSIQHGSATPV